MPELTARTRTREAPGGPTDSLDPFGDETPDPSMATVSSGMYTEQVPSSGASVSELRRRLADRLDIDPNARAVIDGDIVDDEDGATLQAGQLLTFVRHAGEKGNRPVLLDDQVDVDWLTVASGLYSERFAPDGGTVAAWRQRLAERMQIDDGARAFLDGHPIDDEVATTLAGGQTLTFIRQAGEMG